VTRARLVVLLVVAVACSTHPSSDQAAPPAKAALVDTAVAVVERIADVVRVPGVVSPDGLTPETRDAHNDLLSAEARLRLATQQATRLRALSPSDLSPRKDLEAAIAEETSARAAALRARQVAENLGGADEVAAPDPNAVWIVARLPQELVLQVRAGAPASFVADVESRPTFRGAVVAPPAYVDPASRTAPTRVRVESAEQLLPGMTGAVQIEVGVPHDAVVVPEIAVVYDDRHPLVFVDDGRGGLVETAIEIGARRDDRIEVTRGLAAGARVASTGAATLLSAARLATAGEQ